MEARPSLVTIRLAAWSATTPNKNVHGSNQYDSNNRVIKQTKPDGGVFSFNYLLDGNGNVTEADVNDPIGPSCNMTFSSSGYLLSDTRAVGKPEQQTIGYSRDPTTGLVNSITDSLGPTTADTYDTLGNTTSVTRRAATSQAATTSFTYDSTYNQLTSITDPLGHTWSFGLDSNGNIITATDPLGYHGRVDVQYSGPGQLGGES
jgi:YD repeat-containing protein